MPNTSVGFRLNARNIFLTYPQCPLSKETLLEELKKIKAPDYYVIAEELHEDGSPHLHALLRYNKPIDIKRQDYFDIQGHHPNMQTARQPEKVREYVKKDGTYLEHWAEKKDMAEILNEAETPSQFLDLVKENYAEKYVFNLEKVEYAANKLFQRPPSPYLPNPNQGGLTLTPGMEAWLNLEFPKQDRPLSLWLCGPSRTGKTTWARSLGTHIYWSGSFILDTFNESAQYLVLDDIPFEYVPSKKQLFGSQKEFALSDKYRRKRRLKWGKPVIYLFNPDADPWGSLSHSEKEWYALNVQREYITNKLY